MIRLQLDRDAGVRRLEADEPGHEPLLGDRLDRDDADAPGPAALAEPSEELQSAHRHKQYLRNDHILLVVSETLRQTRHKR